MYYPENVLILASELTVKVVNTTNTDKVLYLREQPKPTKHLSFHPSGSYLAASCTNGIVYIYSLSTEEPELVRKVDGVIRTLETDAEASSKAIWHPDGRAFAAPTATRDIQVVSRSDGERQKAFSGGHMGDVTALAWSPNGALLMTAGADRKIMLWETRTQKVVARSERSHSRHFARILLKLIQIRLPECHQHCLAPTRQHGSLHYFRWRGLHLR